MQKSFEVSLKFFVVYFYPAESDVGMQWAQIKSDDLRRDISGSICDFLADTFLAFVAEWI